MMKRIGFLLFAFLGMASAAWADVTIKTIDVKGVQRMEPATVLSYLPFEKGDEVSQSELDQALKELYKTGFFSDVKLDVNGSTLTIEVDERPIVAHIAFEGNDKIEENVLMNEIHMKERDVYTPTKLREDVKRLKTIYQRMGLYSAQITTDVETMSRNRVDIVYKINEGPKNYIEKIRFVGNKHFSSSDLKEELISKEKKWYRFFSSTDTYDPDRLEYDKEMLRRFYYSKGYMDFEIKDVTVQTDEKTKNFIVTFDLDEGKRYRFGTANIQVTLPEVNAQKLEKQITFKKGQIYNAEYIEETIQNITDELGREGYAFVEITPVFKKDPKTQVADVTFKVKEGARVFVNRIDITGNSRTLDKVIRREFRLNEGDPFNTDRIRRSRQRIENLGYFDKVNLKTVPVANAPDKTDIAVDVSEKSTGAFNVGIGWSTYDGLLFEVGVQERNFLGTGKIVGVTASTSGRETQVDLSYTDPYFMDKPISAGFDLFHIDRDYTDDSSYKAKTTGGALRSGWDYSERVRQTVKYTLQQDNVTDIDNDASIYIKEQEGKNVVSMIGQVLSYDTRDNIFNPTEGFYTSLGLDLAGIGGDTRFVRVNANAAKYYEVMDQWVLSVSASAGYIYGLNQEVRINNRYYLGGSTLRGFDVAGVGARDKATGDALGGDWRVTASTQLMFPLGLPSEFGIKGKVFMDAGMLGKPDGHYAKDTIDYNNTPRVSVGTGVLWQSPMGPINIDLGFPIVKEDYDETEVFRLNFGTGF